MEGRVKASRTWGTSYYSKKGTTKLREEEANKRKLKRARERERTHEEKERDMGLVTTCMMSLFLPSMSRSLTSSISYS
jgi:hypothetical protein